MQQEQYGQGKNGHREQRRAKGDRGRSGRRSWRERLRVEMTGNEQLNEAEDVKDEGKGQGERMRGM